MTYYTRLKHLTQTCQFADTTAKSKVKSSNCVRRLNYAEKFSVNLASACKPSSITAKPWSLPKHKFEIWRVQKKALTNSERNTSHIHENENGPRHGPRYGGRHCPWNGPSRSHLVATKCWNCGGTYPNNVGVTGCPVHQKECNNCGKLGHCASQQTEDKTSRARIGENSHDTGRLLGWTKL